jgi:hypothetical protein
MVMTALPQCRSRASLLLPATWASTADVLYCLALPAPSADKRHRTSHRVIFFRGEGC